MNDNPYYRKEIFLAQIDRKDNVTGQVERWYAHREGILHRGFTVILMFKDKILLQHRRHPAFDGFYDLTFSSHQIYENGILQPDTKAIKESLLREWRVSQDDLVSGPEKIGTVYYKAKDPESIYTEHEIDYVYFAVLKRMPDPDPEYSYGHKLIKRDPETFLPHAEPLNLAPWVEKIVSVVKLPEIIK
jgi:isopentenyldiphosphate isomerase